MSAPKATPQQFILGPDKLQSQLPGGSSNNNRPSLPYHDPRLQKEKMSTFKRHLAASRLRSDEAIRRKVELLREQRSKSNLCKSDIQRDMEAASKARMEEELGRPVSSNEWPFVYFVVTLDQYPVSADDPNAEHTTRAAQTARERQRFLTSRRRKIQEARNETERIREAGIDMGLRLEPIKPSAPPANEQNTIHKLRNRPSLTKHPTTPVSSIGSRPEFSLLNSHDDLSDVEMTRRNIGYLISDTLSQAGVVPKNGGRTACPISSLELPEISASAKRRALGTSGSGMKAPGLGERKVTFAESLPVIKGNGIPVGNANTNSYTNTNAGINGHGQSTPKSADYATSPMPSMSDSRSAKERRSGEEDTATTRHPWSTPLTTRSVSNLGPKSRLYAPMALPKVDIVSEIYDELIVKTIHNFLMAEGYSNDKLQQLRHTVLSRLSSTYPHLVKHRAWRLTHSPCDKLMASDEDGEEVIMTDPEKLQPRLKSHQGRLNRVVVERGLTYDQMRPFTSPHGLSYSDSDVTTQSQSFMAIDGRTVTFTPREDIKSARAGILGSSSAVYRKLPTTAEAKEEEEEEEEDIDGGKKERSQLRDVKVSGFGRETGEEFDPVNSAETSQREDQHGKEVVEKSGEPEEENKIQDDVSSGGSAAAAAESMQNEEVEEAGNVDT